MYFGFALDLSYKDLLNIDLLHERYTHLDLLDTDIPSKHFVCLLDVLKTCLQDAFKRSSRSLEDQQMFAGIKWNKYRSEMTNQAKTKTFKSFN